MAPAGQSYLGIPTHTDLLAFTHVLVYCANPAG